MAKEVIATKNAPGAIGPYSQAIKANGFVFASGQLGLVPATGEFAEGGIEEQTRQSLTNVKSVLEAAGSGLEKVVKTTVFLKDIKDFAAMNKVYSEFFKTDCPARSAVQIAALPKDGLVEIEVIAEA
ncbi:MAG: RidA family protein [Acidaminococcaceae bacterium]|jgi:2-iminobutanoate/2-iminopropanoate deaminase|nr:RidA family protein [Acidaminococcaceae bacterium]MBO5605323.1 RidA family protein [Acidaminococcaceae bacterium]MBO6265093.1 RidA family protein [Acidaminococcaceae bacterium]